MNLIERNKYLIHLSLFLDHIYCPCDQTLKPSCLYTIVGSTYSNLLLPPSCKKEGKEAKMDSEGVIHYESGWYTVVVVRTCTYVPRYNDYSPVA